VKLRATVNFRVIFKLSLIFWGFGLKLKFHHRGKRLGNVTRRQREAFYFPLAASINGHPVYHEAMLTRIDACSYRADIRYSFSLSLSLDQLSWAVTISEQSSKRLCARGETGAGTIWNWMKRTVRGPILSEVPRGHERRLSLPVNCVVPMVSIILEIFETSTTIEMTDGCIISLGFLPREDSRRI